MDELIRSIVYEAYDYDTKSYTTSRIIMDYIKSKGIEANDTKLGKALTRLGFPAHQKKLNRKAVSIRLNLKLKE